VVPWDSLTLVYNDTLCCVLTGFDDHAYLGNFPIHALSLPQLWLNVGVQQTLASPERFEQ